MYKASVQVEVGARISNLPPPIVIAVKVPYQSLIPVSNDTLCDLHTREHGGAVVGPTTLVENVDAVASDGI